MKKLALILILSLFFITSCSFIEEIQGEITGETVVEEIKLDVGRIQYYFCPKDNCEEKLVNLIDSSEKIHCAFYELNLPNMISSLEGKDYFIVTDNDHYEEILTLKNTKPDNREALMHNKFCIFDDAIISTGSFNPTVNGNTKNNNNLIIVDSAILARNYEDEFKSFMKDDFGMDSTVRYPQVILNNEILIKNYFCPEDNCEQQVYDIINKANHRIYFMTFSFTSDNLGDLIVEKSKEVEVKGIFDNTQAGSEYSEYHKMIEAGLNVIKDKNPNFMHHKVFIVDDVVILGSYNPTSSGDTANDENILIIYDIGLTDSFLEEFESIWNL
tara:strand:- start:1516 stop:2499 length:984 start_codon:yes stop_codon:yes gene_type:complete